MKMQPKNQATPLTVESLRAQYMASGQKSSLQWAANQIQVVDPAEVKKLILGLDDNGVEFLLVMFNFFNALAGRAARELTHKSDALSLMHHSHHAAVETPDVDRHG